MHPFLTLATVASLIGSGPSGPAAMAGRARLARARPLASSHQPPAGSFPSDPSMPPSKLADAWSRAETITALAEKLKGCSVHVIGRRNGATSSTALALARRLKESRYRFLDLDAVVQQLLNSRASNGDVKPSAAELREMEHAVLEEAKAWTRTVLLVAGEPASQPENWAALHQGIVVLLASPPGATGAEEPPEELWVEQADLQVQLAEESPDESAMRVASAVLKTLNDRPPKSVEWRKQRDQTLKERGVDPNEYDSA